MTNTFNEQSLDLTENNTGPLRQMEKQKYILHEVFNQMNFFDVVMTTVVIQKNCLLGGHLSHIWW